MFVDKDIYFQGINVFHNVQEISLMQLFIKGLASVSRVMIRGGNFGDKNRGIPGNPSPGPKK